MIKNLELYVVTLMFFSICTHANEIKLQSGESYSLEYSLKSAKELVKDVKKNGTKATQFSCTPTPNVHDNILSVSDNCLLALGEAGVSNCKITQNSGLFWNDICYQISFGTAILPDSAHCYNDSSTAVAAFRQMVRDGTCDVKVS